MFNFSSFYKNSLDWVGKKGHQFPGAWSCVLDTSLSVPGYCVPGHGAALQSTCSLKTGQTKRAGEGIQLNVTLQAAGPCTVISANTAACFGHHTQCPHCPSWPMVQARSAKIRIEPSEFSARVSFLEAWVGVDRDPGQDWDNEGDGGRAVRSISCLIRQEEQGAAFPPLHYGSIHHSGHSALEKWQRNPWIPRLELHCVAWMFSLSAVLWPAG